MALISGHNWKKQRLLNGTTLFIFVKDRARVKWVLSAFSISIVSLGFGLFILFDGSWGDGCIVGGIFGASTATLFLGLLILFGHTEVKIYPDRIERYMAVFKGQFLRHAIGFDMIKRMDVNSKGVIRFCGYDGSILCIEDFICKSEAELFIIELHRCCGLLNRIDTGEEYADQQV